MLIQKHNTRIKLRISTFFSSKWARTSSVNDWKTFEEFFENLRLGASFDYLLCKS